MHWGALLLEYNGNITAGTPAKKGKRSGKGPSHKAARAGDFFAVRRKGDAGVDDHQKKVLKSLGLWRAGSTAYGLHDDLPYIRQLVFVSHLVDIEPLTAAAREGLRAWGALRQNLERTTRGGNRMISKEQYEVNGSGRRGELRTFDNGEYIRCQQGKRYYTLKWSSGLPFATVIDTVLPHLQVSLDDSTAFAAFEDGGEVSGAVGRVVAQAKDRRSRVLMFRIDALDHAFAWQAHVGGLVNRPKVSLNECGVAVGDGSDLDVSELVHSSATPAVGERSRSLVRDFAYLISPLGGSKA